MRTCGRAPSPLKPNSGSPVQNANGIGAIPRPIRSHTPSKPVLEPLLVVGREGVEEVGPRPARPEQGPAFRQLQVSGGKLPEDRVRLLDQVRQLIDERRLGG